GLLAAAKNLKVERRGGDLAEADLVQLVRREIRKREEAEDFAARGGRTELVAQNRSEREMLEAYAPSGLDAAALERVIREIAATSPRTRSGRRPRHVRTSCAHASRSSRDGSGSSRCTTSRRSRTTWWRTAAGSPSRMSTPGSRRSTRSCFPKKSTRPRARYRSPRRSAAPS